MTEVDAPAADGRIGVAVADLVVALQGELPPVTVEALGDALVRTAVPEHEQEGIVVSNEADGRWHLEATFDGVPHPSSHAIDELAVAVLGVATELAVHRDASRWHLRASLVDCAGVGVLLLAEETATRRAVARAVARQAGGAVRGFDLVIVTPGSRTVVGDDDPVQLARGSGAQLLAAPCVIDAVVHLTALAPDDARTPHEDDLDARHPAAAVPHLVGVSWDLARFDEQALDLLVATAADATSWELGVRDPAAAASRLFDLFRPDPLPAIVCADPEERRHRLARLGAVGLVAAGDGAAIELVEQSADDERFAGVPEAVPARTMSADQLAPLVDALDRLDGAGISCVVTGTAVDLLEGTLSRAATLARTALPDPTSGRPLRLDAVVATRDRERAHQVLDDGAAVRIRDVGRDLREAVTLVGEPAPVGEAERPLDDLVVADARPLRCGDRWAARPTPAHHFLLAVLAWSNERDVALLAGALAAAPRSAMARDDALREAERWGVFLLVEWVIRTAAEQIGEVPETWHRFFYGRRPWGGRAIGPPSDRQEQP